MSTGAALIRKGGTFEELEGSLGVSILRENPDLARICATMIETGLRSASFLWVEAGKSWLKVELQATRDPAEPDPLVAAHVERVSDAPFELTRREVDILTCLAAGFSNPEIASLLYISRRTVSTHLERILRKLGQKGRAGAAAVAIEQGLLRMPLPGDGLGFEHLSVGTLTAIAEGRNPSKSDHRPCRRPTRSPLLVGLALPGTTGDLDDADEMLNGSLLAIAEINERGGIGGRTIEALDISIDIESTESIEAGLQELIDQDVDAIAVSYSYAEDLSIYAAAAEYGCPLLTAMTSEAQAKWVEVHPSKLGSVFQVVPTERYYGVEFFRLLHKLREAGDWQPRNRTVACIESPGSTGLVVNSRAMMVAEELGWHIGQVSTVSNRNVDWADLIAYLEETSASAVLIAHFVPEEVARFQRLFRKAGSDALVYCVYAPSVPKYLELTGSDAEGVLWSTVAGTYGDEIGLAFTSRYRARFGRDPGRSMAGIAYDQINLLADAWSRVGNPRSFRRVAQELRRGVHRGVNGVYSLGNSRQTGLAYPFETRDPSISQAHLVFQIQDGDHRIISPETYAESEFQVPEWVPTAG